MTKKKKEILKSIGEAFACFALVLVFIFALFGVGAFCERLNQNAEKDDSARITASAEEIAPLDSSYFSHYVDLPVPLQIAHFHISGVASSALDDNVLGYFNFPFPSSEFSYFIRSNVPLDFTVYVSLLTSSGVRYSYNSTAINSGVYVQCPGGFTNVASSFSRFYVSSPVVDFEYDFDIFFVPSSASYSFFDFYNYVFLEGRTEGFTAGKAEGVEEGKNQGYQNGYDEGLKQGSSATRYGIWFDARVDGVFNYDPNGMGIETDYVSITATDLKPDYINAGIGFDSILSQYYYYPDKDWTLTNCTITIKFSIPFVYDSTLNPIIKYGASLVESGYFYTLSGDRFGFDFLYNSEPNDGDRLQLDSGNSLRDVSSMSLYIGRASDLLGEIVLVSRDNSYMGGYNSGYDQGLSVGYGQGYTAGLSIAQNGSFFSLISAVIDAPVHAFSSLLDFEILGFNMRSVVLSLLVTALIMGVIRLFSGGKT